MNSFSELDQQDIYWCVRRMPRPLAAFLHHHPRAVVAGGFIRSCIANETINDIDVFAPDPDLAKAWAQLLQKSAPQQYRAVVETDNAHTVIGSGLPVQFIHRWTFTTPSTVVPSFDFTIARAALWYENHRTERHWASMCDDRFYRDLAAKRLVYCSPDRNEDAGGSILRVLKFYQRGYRIPLDSMGAVIARLVKDIDIEKCDLADEAHVSRILTGLLREVDPFLDPEHLAHMPSSQQQESPDGN